MPPIAVAQKRNRLAPCSCQSQAVLRFGCLLCTFFIACASAGSACSAGAVEPSHVLLALGLTPAQAKSTLRLTLDAANTAEEIDTAAAVITACVQRLRDGVR